VADRRVLDMGGRYVFVRADLNQLGELAQLAAAGELRVPVRETFGFAPAARPGPGRGGPRPGQGGRRLRR